MDNNIDVSWSKEQEIQHRAEAVSFRIMSVVEKECDKRGLTKKELARKIGTSPSYITQLYRGSKQVNTSFMGKIEVAFGVQFFIEIH